MKIEDSASKEEKERWCGVLPRKVAAVVSVLCCFFLQCILGFTYTFANINPYVTSYLRNKTKDDDVDYTDTLWLPQTLSITEYVIMPCVGILSTRMTTKLYLCIGLLFTAASFFGSYWSVQTSLPLTVVTYGMLGGVPHAILYPGCINIALRWVPEHRGLITGLVLTGYGLGAVAWNQLTTCYINRDNLEPDVTVGEDKYFSQSSVLDRVPSCFLLMGTIFTAGLLVCVLVICDPPVPPVPPVPSQVVIITKSSAEKENLIPATNKEVETSFLEKAEKSYQTRPARDEKHRENYHPREVVRCRVFWTLWAVMTFTYMGTAIVTNLFKAYGQTFINDDHYLSLVASLSSVFNAAGRPFCGMMADRFGFRIVAVVAQCVLACLVATVFTCEVTGREMFCVWVCAMYLAMCGLLTLIPALVFTLFGPRYFNVNMGLMDSSGIFSSVITGSVAPILKEAFGWHGLFFVAFAVIFIGILLNLSLSINCNEGSIPRHMYTDLSLT